jgi:hypothetical protein
MCVHLLLWRSRLSQFGHRRGTRASFHGLYAGRRDISGGAAAGEGIREGLRIISATDVRVLAVETEAKENIAVPVIRIRAVPSTTEVLTL